MQPKRVGYGSYRWTNVGPDEYFFYFYKSYDGVIVWSDDVYMYND